MLTGEQMVAVSRAAMAPDTPLSVFGLDDTPEVRAAIAAGRACMANLPADTIFDLPSDWPTAGNADFLYSPEMSAAALAKAFFADENEPALDATALEAERQSADSAVETED